MQKWIKSKIHLTFSQIHFPVWEELFARFYFHLYDCTEDQSYKTSKKDYQERCGIEINVSTKSLQSWKCSSNGMNYTAYLAKTVKYSFFMCKPRSSYASISFFHSLNFCITIEETRFFVQRLHLIKKNYNPSSTDCNPPVKLHKSWYNEIIMKDKNLKTSKNDKYQSVDELSIAEEVKSI